MELFVLTLENVKIRHQEEFGSKAANLGVIAREMKTAPGFAVSSKVYTESLKQACLLLEITEMACNVEDRSIQEIAPVSQKITEKILAMEILAKHKDLLLAEYHKLWPKEPPLLAVRSSATSEDLPSASFAGQLDSFLNVAGEDAYLEAVKKCWASLWTPRAIHYRKQKGIGQKHAAMAVIVQEMVKAEAAGVMFTANPVTNSRQEIYIEAIRGLGESLVSGETNADVYLVKKDKLFATYTQLLEDRPILSEYQLKVLASAGKKLEFLYNQEQDIEWAMEKGEIYILQTRPITTLDEEERPLPDPKEMTPVQREVWTNINERFPEPVLPIDGIIAKIYYQSLFSAYHRLDFHVPYVDWKLVEEGFFPEYFSPPAITKKPWRRFKLRTVDKLDIEQEWRDNENVFNRYLALLQNPQLPTFPMETVMEYLEDALNDFQRALYLRYLLYIRYNMKYNRLVALAEKKYGSDGRRVLDIAVAGERQITMDLNDEMQALAAMAQEDTALVRVILEGDLLRMEEEIEEKLGDSPFLEKYRDFMAKYGDREISQGLGGLAAALWRDEPLVVWGMIRGLLKAEIAGESKGEETVLTAANQKILRELQSDGKTVALIGDARRYNAFRENSHFYLTQAMTVFSSLFLQLGNRIEKQGLLEKGEDIVYFTYYEIRDIIFNIHSQQKLSRLELEEMVQARKARQKRRERRWLGRKTGEQFAYGDVIQGAAASGGMVRGKCRIIKSPQDFHLLEPGDIMVAEYTNPSWTPVFSFIDGLIVEYGSAVSHAAIIAREYGIPAVFGIDGIVDLLENGEEILLDGSRGLIKRGNLEEMKQ